MAIFPRDCRVVRFGSLLAMTTELSLFDRFAVELLVDLAQMLVGDVGVDLGRRDRGVAEHALHRADVGAVREQVGREGVA